MDDIIKGIQINSAGFGTISKLAMQDRRLHITAKAIYAYFNSYAGAGDTCFPSRKKICYDLGISADTFGKGRMIALEGQLRTRTYDDKHGSKHYVTEVYVDNASFTGEKKQNDVHTNPEDSFGNPDDYEDILSDDGTISF